MTNDGTLPPIPFSPKARLIVGVSGGSDSLGLLLFLQEQLPNSSQRLVAAHVNYGLRGAASDRDEAVVRRFCKSRHLPFKKLRVRRFKDRVRREGRSLQELAREVRYVFFQKLVRQEKAWGVAVAHHLEDQAETLLDRLLRGSGPRGLSGLRQVQKINFDPVLAPLSIWRPLLGFSKGQIQSFLKSRKIPWREDGSNRENQYRRNQIRNEILPFLSRWNPGLMEALARLGEITATEDLFMDGLLASVGPALKSRWGRREYHCRADAFGQIPLALQRRWVRRAAERLSADARGLSFERIEETIRLWCGQGRGPKDLGFGLAAGRDGARAFLRKKD